jgi:hypothetical protein
MSKMPFLKISGLFEEDTLNVKVVDNDWIYIFLRISYLKNWLRARED